MTRIPVLKRSEFILREIDLIKDRKDIQKNINDKDILQKLTLDYPYKKENWQDFVQWNKAIKRKEDKSINWMIYINNECVGGISIIRSNKQMKKHIGEIACWLARKYWNQGIMTEAIGMIVNYAFNKLKLLKLKWRFQEGNIASKRVAEKTGFKFEYIAAKETLVDGKYKDYIFYCLFKEGFN